MSFGENLKATRKAKGYTRKFIADKIGVAQPMYGYYETGRSVPRLDNLVMLSQLLGVSIDYLLDNTTDEQRHQQRIIGFLAGKLAAISGNINDKPMTTEEVIAWAEKNVKK